MLVTTCLMDACSFRLQGRCLHNSRIWKKGTRCCSAGYRRPRSAPAGSLASVVVFSSRAPPAAQCGDCWCVPYNGTGSRPRVAPRPTPGASRGVGRAATNPFALDCDQYADAACATSPARRSSARRRGVRLLARGGDCAACAMRSFASARARARRRRRRHTRARAARVDDVDLAAYVAPRPRVGGKACGRLLSERGRARAERRLLRGVRAWVSMAGRTARRARARVHRPPAPNNEPPPCALNDCPGAARRGGARVQACRPHAAPVRLKSRSRSRATVAQIVRGAFRLMR